LSATLLEDEAAYVAAQQIKQKVKDEVRRYVDSADFKSLVDSLKRAERERAMREIEAEVAAEKARLLAAEKQKVHQEVATERDAKEVLLQNKLAMEEQQRRAFEEQQRANAQRLAEIQQRVEAEQRSEADRLARRAQEQAEKEQILSRCVELLLCLSVGTQPAEAVPFARTLLSPPLFVF